MKYMFLLFGDEGVWARMTEEERQAEYARHGALAEELVNAGKAPAGEELVPSSQARTLRVEGTPRVTDGPFLETREQLGGFYIIDCADMEEALAWAQKIPMAGGSVEVRPIVESMG
jgi:hypothetical protein